MSSVLVPARPREGISDGELSPELALVDPDLAAAARMLLPDPVEIERARPSSPALRTAQPRPLAPVEQKPAAPAPSPARRRRLVPVAAGVAAAVVGVVGLVLAASYRAADTAPGTDASSAALQARAARICTWPAVPGAEAYEFELVRGAEAVFQTTTRNLAVELPAHLRLSPGRYTWTVTPTFANQSVFLRRPVVEATFDVASSQF